MRIPWYAKAGVVAGTGFAAIFLAAPSAFAAVALTRLSTDTFTNPTSQHATQVEPDTYAFGSTIVMAAQTGRFNDGGASDIAYATSTNNGATWTGGNLPGITTFAGGGPYNRVSDAAVAYDAQPQRLADLHAAAAGGRRRARGGDPHQPVHRRRRSPSATRSPSPPAATSTRTGSPATTPPTSPFYGNCYTEWDDHGNGNRIKMSTSTDGGLTWGAAKNTGNNATGIGGQPVVQPNGTVVVPIASATETSIRAFRSTNGGSTWGAAGHHQRGNRHTVAGSLRTGPLPSAEIDGAGKVYVVWQDCRFRSGCTANDIVMSTSTDGATWTTVVRIPIDATSSTVDHFIPGLAVDRTTSGSTGHLALTYYLLPGTQLHRVDLPVEGRLRLLDQRRLHLDRADRRGRADDPVLARPTSQGPMVGDYISTSFGSDGKAHGTFAVANAPSGSVLDEAIYTTATGLSAAAGTTAVNTFFLPAAGRRGPG